MEALAEYFIYIILWKCGVIVGRFYILYQIYQLFDRPIVFYRVTKMHICVDFVRVAPSLANSFYISVNNEIRNNPLYRALGYSHFLGNIAHPHGGVFREAEQHMGMIC